MLTILNVPFIAAIPYIYFYGIRDQWIMTGLAVWLAAGVGAKILKLPVYSKIALSMKQTLFSWHKNASD